MIALKEAYLLGLLQPKHWFKNIIAGLIVGVVALPLAMAFGIASGVKPEQGIYTAIIAGLAVSILGGSRLQIAGPTGAFIVILSGITAQYGVVGLQIATMMAGVMLFLMGFAKLGGVIRFIPVPVITGFTTGIGVIIWVGQWKDFFGLPAIEGTHFHEKIWHLIEALPLAHASTSLLALFALSLLLLTPKIPYLRKVPAPLLAMLAVTGIQAYFQFDGVATIGSAFGGIPQGLPEFSIPPMRAEQVISLIGPAFTIAMLGSIESLLSAVVADGMAGTKHDSNQELKGQGIANIIAPMFGGFAATGAIARTATNIRNGANGPIAGIVHAIFLVAVLLFLAPLATDIPLAVLAAILFVVAYNMSEIKHFIHILKHAPKSDIVVLLITFLLTVFADLVVAVNIGVILAILNVIRKMSQSVMVQRTTSIEQKETLDLGMETLPDDVCVYTIEGPFFFATVHNFESALVNSQTMPKILCIRLRYVPFVDATAIQALLGIIKDLKMQGVDVYLFDANEQVEKVLAKSKILDLLASKDVCRDLHRTLLDAKVIQC